MTADRGRCATCNRVVAVFGGDYAVAHNDATNRPCPGYGKQVTELVAAPPKPQPTPAPDGTDYLTVAEIAPMLRVAKMTVYRLIHSGELRARRFGQSYRIHRTALQAYMAGAEVVVEAETA